MSAEVFNIFSQGEDSESCGNSLGGHWDESCDLSDCNLVIWTGPPRWLRCVKVLRRIMI